MTVALCFNCGGLKFGALCPCPDCGVASTGNVNVDISFSDHHYDASTLEGFGAVLRAIGSACPDPKTRFWAFIHHVSEHYPEVLHADVGPDMARAVAGVLDGLELPSVVVRASPRKRAMMEEQGDAPPDGPDATGDAEGPEE